MRARYGAWLLLAISAQAQAPEPPWLLALRSIQQQAHEAPLNSPDQKVDEAWRAALQIPGHPLFPTAAQITADYYVSQGYDLKAEQIWHQALATAPESRTSLRRGLTVNLAGHLESTQQLVRALAIREDLAKRPLPDESDPALAGNEAAALAVLHERMGEFEKAEAAWKTVAELRFAKAQGRAVRSDSAASIQPDSFRYPRGRNNEVANFYSRHGRLAEGEVLYKEDLSEAVQGNSPDAWLGAADSYTSFLSQQRRYDEALELIRQGIAVIEGAANPDATSMVLFKHKQMAGILNHLGRTDEALVVRYQAAETAQAGNLGSFEIFEVLQSLAWGLFDQGRLGAAEEAVSRMRAVSATSDGGHSYFDFMALQLLARIRDRQGRSEEAREIRSSAGIPDFAPPSPNSQVKFQYALDAADEVADAVAAVSNGRTRMGPGVVAWLVNVVHALKSTPQEYAARRRAVETLRLLDQLPDHPSAAKALGSAISAMIELDMRVEADRTIERLRQLLISAKGPESLDLNSVGSARIALFRLESTWVAILDERKRMLARAEQTTGPKSTESLYALRELAWEYPGLDNWPEEETVLLTLRERTANLRGPSSLDHAQILEHLSNRAAQNRQFDKALDWMDQAIEIARKVPEASLQLAGMMQERASIVSAKEGTPNGPFLEPQGSQAGPAGRWMNSDAFQHTDGAQLGGAPGGTVGAGQPGVRGGIRPGPEPPSPSPATGTARSPEP